MGDTAVVESRESEVIKAVPPAYKRMLRRDRISMLTTAFLINLCRRLEEHMEENLWAFLHDLI